MLVSPDKVTQDSEQEDLSEAPDDFLAASNILPTDALLLRKGLRLETILCGSTLLLEQCRGRQGG